jgi:hypothetical protein
MMLDGHVMLIGTCGLTVTVKVQVLVLPHRSLAVARTVVVPQGKTLPLGGLRVTEGIVQPPEAVKEKYTTAPLGPVAVVVMFDGQVTLIGTCGLTVTVKVQVLVLPHRSLAVARTVVVPQGKTLPLGGLSLTEGIVQPPEAVKEKYTTAPLGPVAVVVMFDGHVTLIGTWGLTVTVKLQVALFPQLSLALPDTVVVPQGKTLPLGGLKVTDGVLQPPAAVA